MADVAIKRVQAALEGGFTPPGTGSVYTGGSPLVATRRWALEAKPQFDWKPTYSRPVDARGSYAGSYQSLLELMEATGKGTAALYCDDLTFHGRMAYSGAPTITTLPSSPNVLLAATAIAATMSLTTQPNAGPDGALGQILAVTLSNTSASTTSVTITVTGTDVYGNVLTEQVVFSAGTTTPSKVGGGAGALSCTLYTQHYFRTVTAAGIVTSAQPTGDLVAVGGVYAFLWKFAPDMRTPTLYSATVEYDDGVAGWQIPGVLMNKHELEIQFGKSMKATLDMMAQKKVALAASTGSINPSAQAGSRDALQNLADNNMAALASALGNFWTDPMGATPGTTNLPGRITDFKFGVDNQLKLIKGGDGTPYVNQVGRGTYGDKLTCEFTLLFTSYLGSTVDPAELQQFLNNASRTIRVAVPGAPLPCGVLTSTGGWPAALQQSNFGGSYGVIYDVAGRYTLVSEKDVDERVAHTYKLESEVDLETMGVPYSVQVVSRVNPNMV